MAEARKKTSRRRVPWGQILGKPIERMFALSRVDELFEREERRDEVRREIEQKAFAEQFKKMCLLKQHYEIEGKTGWRPWYKLALAVASEFDDGLKILDPPLAPSGKTAPRWRGAEGQELLMLVEIYEEELGPSLLPNLAQLREDSPNRYGLIPLDTLEKNYYDAKRHHRGVKGSGTTKRSRKKRSTS